MSDEEHLPSLDEATESLKIFFENHPYSKIDKPDEDSEVLSIIDPWGDESVALTIRNGFQEICDVLNSVILPKRFSALYHKKSGDLEVIWTALNLPENQKEVFGRKFSFSYKGKDHLCEFKDSSNELNIIAKHSRPQLISSTNHRNLQSISTYARYAGEKDLPASYDKPKSFWISDVEWDESGTVDLISHLNFYMKYFDFLTPTVRIHSPDVTGSPSQRTRYIKGHFPSVIEGGCLDENLLSFWHFADDGNPMLRFLLYYRIIEYAAVHFIEDNIRHELKKVISSPDLRSDISGSIETMVSAMNASKLSDAQRLQAVMRKSIDPDILWREMKGNFTFFTKDTKFEGGFSIKAVVGDKDTDATFRVRGVEGVADAFRKIRNALSHGKDQETAAVIRPTPRNFILFRPWVHLIATASGEVVLYRAVT